MQVANHRHDYYGVSKYYGATIQFYEIIARISVLEYTHNTMHYLQRPTVRFIWHKQPAFCHGKQRLSVYSEALKQQYNDPLHDK